MSANPDTKKCVGIKIVLPRQGHFGPKCRHLAVGETCRRHAGNFISQGAVHRVASPSRHPSPSPLHHRCAPFPLLSLVDCCLLPLLRCRRAFHCHRYHQRCVTVASYRVRRASLPSLSSSSSRLPPPPPCHCLPFPPPAVVDC